MTDPPLMSLIPTTDFEKRLFAEREIKDLKIEMGKLNAYITELEDHVNKHRGNDPKWTPEEKLAIRKDEQVVRLKARNNDLVKKNKSLRRANSDLIAKLHNKGENDSKWTDAEKSTIRVLKL